MRRLIFTPARLILRHTPLNCAMFNPIKAAEAVAESLAAAQALDRELRSLGE